MFLLISICRPAIAEQIGAYLGQLSHLRHLSRVLESLYHGKGQHCAGQDEIDYDKLKDQLRYQLNELAKNQWNLVTSSKQLIQAGRYPASDVCPNQQFKLAFIGIQIHPQCGQAAIQSCPSRPGLLQGHRRDMAQLIAQIQLSQLTVHGGLHFFF